MLLHSTVDVYVYRMCVCERRCSSVIVVNCALGSSVCNCTDFQFNTDPCLPLLFCMKMYREVYVFAFFFLKVSHLKSHCTC